MRLRSEVKDLSRQRSRQKRVAGTTKHTKAEVKGILVEFAWQLKKDGYADSSIKTYTKIIHVLVKRNVNVFNPEDVKESLRHRKIDTTLLYVQLEKALFKEMTDEFTVKASKTPKEIQNLLEVGFEYVCEKDGLMFLREKLEVHC